MRVYVVSLYWGLVVLMIVGIWRLRTRRLTVGPAMGASMTELMDDRRRVAIEIIIEERTAERDVEDRDGNLPDLAAGSSVVPRSRPSHPK